MHAITPGCRTLKRAWHAWQIKRWHMSPWTSPEPTLTLHTPEGPSLPSSELWHFTHFNGHTLKYQEYHVWQSEETKRHPGTAKETRRTERRSFTSRRCEQRVGVEEARVVGPLVRLAGCKTPLPLRGRVSLKTATLHTVKCPRR